MEEISFGEISETAKGKPKAEPTPKAEPQPKVEKGPIPAEPVKTEPKILPTAEVDKMIDRAHEDFASAETGLNTLIMGAEGTGKSGIAQDYVCPLSKKTMIIDLDGHNVRLLRTYHKKEGESGKVIVLQPLKDSVIEDSETRDVKIDWHKALNIVKAIVKNVSDNREKYSAIVLDGVSELLKYAENQMRMEKHITPDGGVSNRYWKNRADKFREVLEAIRSIPKIDKIYIAHEDFIIGEGKSAMVKMAMNQKAAQRIICRRVEKTQADGSLEVKFVAKINKSKYNVTLEGKEIVFATVNKGKVSWDTSDIFKGL